MAEEYLKKVENVLKEVCSLTDTDCDVHLAKFKEDGNIPLLLNSIFTTLDSCKSEKCSINKPKIFEKLDSFIKDETGG